MEFNNADVLHIQKQNQMMALMFPPPNSTNDDENEVINIVNIEFYDDNDDNDEIEVVHIEFTFYQDAFTLNFLF